MVRTLSIIKPDAVLRSITGKINACIEGAGFNIVAQKMIRLSLKQAQEFYSVHRERPFFDDLCDFMVSGSIVVQVLERENAVLEYRKIMGDTDPKKAAQGTIRGDFADSIDANCVHGSDSEENAAKEISFFFSVNELL